MKEGGKKVIRAMLWVVAVVVGTQFFANAAPSAPNPWLATPADNTAKERVYLIHSDNLSYNRYGNRPEAQILTGRVQFLHKGATLNCDSAYFFETSNSFEAFGHVVMRQGDTLSLSGEYAYYDGNEQMAYTRRNVVLRHRDTFLYTDSLDFDRIYNLGYFYEGGKMTDKENVLTSDWGQYDTQTREAVFLYEVRLTNPKLVLDTDTLYYYTSTSMAHVVGPSVITSGQSVINTTEGYYDTDKGVSKLYKRSKLNNGWRSITADSLVYDETTSVSEAFGNVFYDDANNKNALSGNYVFSNDSTGYAFATDSAVAMEYSQGDTLYMHSDTIKMFTYNINTDSVWRKIHCYNKVRAYRTDMQAVCDSLVYSTLDSCMTMYKDPITWYGERQLLGETIEVYMRDSTVDRAHVSGQAFSIDRADGEKHFNQISSREMFAYFKDGTVDAGEAIGNVLAIYYPVDEKDTSLIGHVYVETDTLRMFMNAGVLDKIWMPKSKGTMYPMTQIPPDKLRLTGFAWFDYVRPLSKEDIFVWRGKAAGTELKKVKRTAAPLQVINNGAVEMRNEEQED